jgi:hypothetical protein
VGCLTDPKMNAYFSQLLGAGEEILWFQERRFGSPDITYFAFSCLGISILWSAIILLGFLIGLSIGTPASHPWWVWAWSVIVIGAVTLLPVLGSLELLKALKNSVHVLTQKRLILTNTRWRNYSLKIGPIDNLRLERRQNGQSNVLLKSSPSAAGLPSLLPFMNRTILSNIKNPDLFASVLAKHGRQAHSNCGALK